MAIGTCYYRTPSTGESAIKTKDGSEGIELNFKYRDKSKVKVTHYFSNGSSKVLYDNTIVCR